MKLPYKIILLVLLFFVQVCAQNNRKNSIRELHLLYFTKKFESCAFRMQKILQKYPEYQKRYESSLRSILIEMYRKMDLQDQERHFLDNIRRTNTRIRNLSIQISKLNRFSRQRKRYLEEQRRGLASHLQRLYQQKHRLYLYRVQSIFNSFHNLAVFTFYVHNRILENTAINDVNIINVSWEANATSWEIIRHFYTKKAIEWTTEQKIKNTFDLQKVLSMQFNLYFSAPNKQQKTAFENNAWRKGLVSAILREEKLISLKIQKNRKLQKTWQQYRNVLSNLAAYTFQEISGNTSQIRGLITQRNTLEKKISIFSNIPQILNAQVLSLDKVQQTLTKEDLLLDYFTYLDLESKKKYIGVFVITHNSIRCHKLGVLNEIKLQIKSIYKRISEIKGINNFSEEESSLKEHLASLTQKIFPIQNSQNIIVSPDDILNFFPMGILVQKDDQDKYNYIAEQRYISYITSTRSLLRKYNAIGSGFLGMANPKFSLTSQHKQQMLKKWGVNAKPIISKTNLQYPQLKNQELQKIINTQSLFTTKNIQSYYGEQALEVVFKQQAVDKKWLHIVTHGFFIDPQQEFITVSKTPGTIYAFQINPDYKFYHPLLNSGLVFSGNGIKIGIDDGYLTAQEVALLPLQAHCGVFPACSTGLGEIKSGEGIWGLKSALEYSGVHYSILSLWNIADFESEDLMLTFYRESAKYPVWKAITLAQRKYIADLRQNRNHSHPYFWAAFVCNGKPTTDVVKVEYKQPKNNVYLSFYGDFATKSTISMLENGVAQPTSQKELFLDQVSQLCIESHVDIHVLSENGKNNLSLMQTGKKVSLSHSNLPEKRLILAMSNESIDMEKVKKWLEIHRGFLFGKKKNKPNLPYPILIISVEQEEK